MPISSIIVASSNADKIRELKTIAKEFGINLLSPSEVRDSEEDSAIGEVEETGNTYLENAKIKAQAYSSWYGLPALGDDSGLEVVALNNAPGIYSARYAGHGASDHEKMAKVLRELKLLESKVGQIDRTAYFKCALFLCFPDGRTLSEECSMKGQVLPVMQGEKGFGYDPIILIDSLGKTLAELDFEQTCKVGFRAKAAQKLFKKLSSF